MSSAKKKLRTNRTPNLPRGDQSIQREIDTLTGAQAKFALRRLLHDIPPKADRLAGMLADVDAANDEDARTLLRLCLGAAS